MDRQESRLWSYAVSSTIAFGVFLLTEAPAQGSLFLLFGAGCLAALANCCIRRRLAASSAISWAALAALASVLYPVAESVIARHASLAFAIGSTLVAPQLFVTLLSSRLLATHAELHFAAFAADPVRGSSSARLQSLSSAVALAAFLLFVVYGLLVPALSTDKDGVSTLIIAASSGASWAHSAIILLFFFVMALILEAFAQHRRDCAALKRICAFVGAAAVEDREGVLRRALQREEDAFGPSMTVYLLQRDMSQRQSCSSYAEFFKAGRGFARSLPPLLPLLGFLGTVVGLSMSMYELQKGLAPGATPNVSGALTGLAVKFETTLLGLLANLIALFLLNALERGEAELAARCRGVAEAALAPIRSDPAPHA